MRRRKHEFSAVMVLEAGKSWVEADADTAEAIDFLEYYARQAVRIADSSAQLDYYAPEQLGLYYIPLGVGAIIPPWNFPLAIVAGMTSAALVTGNTVVLKPAEQTPWVAYKLCQLFWDQALPPGVLNYVTCADGAVVGGRLVEHPQTRFISFTGSKAVGVQIYETGGESSAGAEVAQAGDPRNGRQGCRLGRRDRRPRQRCCRDRRQRLRFSGAEVLGWVARDHRRQRLRSGRDAGGRTGAAAADRRD